MSVLLLLSFLVSLGVSQGTCSADPTIGCPQGTSCTTVNKCPQYTEGYNQDPAKREVWKYTCIAGKWESITCAQLPPENFKYPLDDIKALVNTPITSLTPTIECYNCIFKLTDGQSLPAGLIFDTLTGTISGTPTVTGKTVLTIIARAEEAASDQTFDLAFDIYTGCPAEDGWPITQPGEEAVRECEGDLVGYKTRKCSDAATWESANIHNCLTKTPEKGVSFVDITLHLVNGVTQQIKRENALGIVSTLMDSFPNLDILSVGIHSIHTIDTNTGIYIRITGDQAITNEVYDAFKQEVGPNHVLTKMSESITQSKKNYYTGDKAELRLHDIQKFDFKTDSETDEISLGTKIVVGVILIFTVIVILCTIIIVWTVNISVGKLTKLEKKKRSLL